MPQRKIHNHSHEHEETRKAVIVILWKRLDDTALYIATTHMDSENLQKNIKAYITILNLRKYIFVINFLNSFLNHYACTILVYQKLSLIHI